MLTLYVLVLAALSGTAVRAGNMVLVLYALKLGSCAFVIGLLGAMFAVLPMLFSMPAGRLADRYGSRAAACPMLPRAPGRRAACMQS